MRVTGRIKIAMRFTLSQILRDFTRLIYSRIVLIFVCYTLCQSLLSLSVRKWNCIGRADTVFNFKLH